MVKNKLKKLKDIAVVGAICAFGFYELCTPEIKVNGHSMYPMLYDGDSIETERFPFLDDRVKLNDIVIAICPTDGVKIVKRVLGVPGDSYNFEGKLFQIKKGEYFLRGESVDSLDSRFFGPVPVIGRVTSIHKGPRKEIFQAINKIYTPYRYELLK